MSGAAFGRLDGDFIGRSYSIFGKLVIDEECNLIVANATVNNATIQDTLFVGKIFEEEALEGITFTGNVMMNEGYAVISPLILANIAQVDYLRERSEDHEIIVQSNVCVQDGNILKASHITEQTSGNGVVISHPISKYRFGLGKAHLQGIHTIDESPGGSQIEFTEKTFESFNPATGVIHPEGNTLITFQAPTTDVTGFEYGNAFVRVSTTLGLYFTDAEAGDRLKFRVIKDKSSIASQYTHTLAGPCIDAEQTFSWTDLISVTPGQVLDIYVEGDDFSGNLDANILGGESITSVSFTIETFEP